MTPIDWKRLVAVGIHAQVAAAVANPWCRILIGNGSLHSIRVPLVVRCRQSLVSPIDWKQAKVIVRYPGLGIFVANPW